MTMKSLYVDTSFANAYILATGGRHVDHSMDATCEEQLSGWDFWAHIQFRETELP